MPFSTRQLIVFLLLFAGCGHNDPHPIVVTPSTEVATDARFSVHGRILDSHIRDVREFEVAVNVNRVREAAWVIAVGTGQAERSARVVAMSGKSRRWPSVATPGNYNATGSVNGYPCGGDLPSCCTLRKESGGIPTAQNPTSSSSGLWQFTHDTWAGFGGYSEAKYAPADVQNERARQVFDHGRGWRAWIGDHCYPGG